MTTYRSAAREYFSRQSTPVLASPEGDQGEVPSKLEPACGRGCVLEADIRADDVSNLLHMIEDIVIRKGQLPHAVAHDDCCAPGYAL